MKAAKGGGGGRHTTHRGIIIQVRVIYHKKTMKARRQWNDIFKELKGKVLVNLNPKVNVPQD